MKASILDLRYRTKDILKALRNREKVTILYHGIETGIIHPVEPENPPGAAQTEFFGMYAKDKESVQTTMKRLRKNRYAL